MIIHEETQVAEGGWVEGERGERTPFEASLLSSLDHPGIEFMRDEHGHNELNRERLCVSTFL